jgi:hypothetical protein
MEITSILEIVLGILLIGAFLGFAYCEWQSANEDDFDEYYDEVYEEYKEY